MSEFHFLRPWWLLAVVPSALALWALWRKSDHARSWGGVITPHLLPHLLVGKQHSISAKPLLFLGIGWSMAALALAGPTWKREPSPFADDTSVLVVVLKVTPSMQTPDIEPTRLARAVEKIHDILALRPGAKTALIAYSGSAHSVMPMTTDSSIITSFAAELEPTVLPVEGDVAAAALAKASAMIKRSGQPGWILWIADAAAETQLPLLEKSRGALAPVSVLACATPGPEFDSLQKAAGTLDSSFIEVTPDDADVERLAKNTRFSPAAQASGEHWQDAGYFLVPALCLLSLAWFRRGWVLPTGAIS